MEPIQVLITLDPRTGQLGVQGPLDKMILVLGMLEAAKQIVVTAPKQEPPRIIGAEGPAALELARRAHVQEGGNG